MKMKIKEAEKSFRKSNKTEGKNTTEKRQKF